MLRPIGAIYVLSTIVLCYLYLDRPFALWMQKLGIVYIVPWLRTFTKLGLGYIYIVFFSCLAFYYRFIVYNKLFERRAWFLWSCVVIPGIFDVLLKMILGRARPELLYNYQAYGFFWFKTKAAFLSFPSGHTTNVMGLMFGLSILWPKYFKQFLLAGFTIAFSRVILTHHFLSDILSACYLALAIVIMLYSKFWSRNLNIDLKCSGDSRTRRLHSFFRLAASRNDEVCN